MELQITQTRHYLSISDGKKHLSKIRKQLSNVHKIISAYIKCPNNNYAKFEYKGMKIVGVTDYIIQTPPKHFGLDFFKVQHPSNNFLSRVHKIAGRHL